MMSRKKKRKSLSQLNTLQNFRKLRRRIERFLKLGKMLELGILLVLFLLLLQSHSRASLATEQLMTFKEEESMLLLQLQKIEKQSIKLHENIRLRMKRAGIEKEDVTLNDQTSELYEMAQELNGQVAAVQASIEASARDKIITEYGEGPVKVVFELEFFDESQGSGLKNTAFFKLSGSTSYITLLLWPPTPHAAWTWLEQIGRHVWDESKFRWSSNNEPVLELSPSKRDPLQRGQLQFTEFDENIAHWHDAWSIGVRNSHDGTLQMILNISDNHDSQDTCIGRIVDGFNTLQRFFKLPTNNDGELTTIKVKRVSATHMTHTELANIEH